MLESTKEFLEGINAHLHNDRIGTIEGQGIAEAIEEDKKMQKDFEDRQTKKKEEAAKYTKSSHFDAPPEAFKGLLDNVKEHIKENLEREEMLSKAATREEEDRAKRIIELEARIILLDSKIEEAKGNDSKIIELERAKAKFEDEIKALRD